MKSSYHELTRNREFWYTEVVTKWGQADKYRLLDCLPPTQVCGDEMVPAALKEYVRSETQFQQIMTSISSHVAKLPSHWWRDAEYALLKRVIHESHRNILSGAFAQALLAYRPPCPCTVCHRAFIPVREEQTCSQKCTQILRERT